MRLVRAALGFIDERRLIKKTTGNKASLWRHQVKSALDAFIALHGDIDAGVTVSDLQAAAIALGHRQPADGAAEYKERDRAWREWLERHRVDLRSRSGKGVKPRRS